MAKTFQDLLNEGQAKVLGIVSIVPMDDWNTDTQYQKLNLVRHNGAAYLAKGGSKNVEPGVTQDWQSSWMLVYLDGILSPDGTYPNLTAGRVMHALAWGNKNYDGSSAQTITAADLGLADVYKPQGSIAFASLPATPNESNYGYVWNITNDFTTDSRFIEGAGKKYSAGTNVGVIEQDGQYYYDILGNFVDLSNYAKIDGNYQEMTVGQATNAQNAANVTAQINGHAISDIFETDGTTVKEATQAEVADRVGSIVIQNNADLNDCTANLNEVQVYTCQQNVTAATLLNCPVDATFTMWTTRAFEESSNSSRDFQFLIATNNQCYYRVRSGGTEWANWQTLVAGTTSSPISGVNLNSRSGFTEADYISFGSATSGNGTLGSYTSHAYLGIRWTKTNSSGEQYVTAYWIPTILLVNGDADHYFCVTDSEDFVNFWFSSTTSFNYTSSKISSMRVSLYDYNT